MKNREITTGLNGSGHKIWIVVTQLPNRQISWREVFSTEAEARHWAKWA